MAACDYVSDAMHDQLVHWIDCLLPDTDATLRCSNTSVRAVGQRLK
jgi:hypothetical protein